MIIQTLQGRKYEVAASQTCVVTYADGSLVGVASPFTRSCFLARASQVELSDESATVRALPVPSRRHSYRKTEIPLRLELSDKYRQCVNVGDLQSIRPDYVAELSAGVWLCSLASLQNGDSAFMSVVAMRDFLADLPSLQSGKNMFAGCSLSLCSVKRIAFSVPCVSGGVLTLGIDIRQKKSPALAEYLSVLEDKGWTLEVQYNTPPGVPTLAELEYLEHTDSTGNNTLTYFALPLPNVTSPQDSLIYETEHMKLPPQSIKEGEGCPMNLGCFILCNGIAYDGSYTAVDGVLNNPSSLNATHADWVFPFSVDAEQWSKIRISIGDASNQRFNVFVNDELLVNQELRWGENLAPRTVFYLFGYPNQTGSNSAYTRRVFRGKKRTAKIWINEQLLYDLVPVLDETGVACMFDKVSQQYFYHEGEGTFNWVLKSTLMRLRRTESRPLELPRSPIWARLNEGVLEWCHYTGSTEGWQQFTSLEAAQEILGN